jgi:hypothetical protein
LDTAATVTLLKLVGDEPLDDPADPGAAQLRALLDGDDVPAEAYRSERYCPDAPPAAFSLQPCYRLLTTNFGILCNDPNLFASLRGFIEHLALPSAAVPDLIIEVRQAQPGRVRLIMNGAPQGNAMPEKMLIPCLLDRLRKHAYQRVPYLLALHAAALRWKGRSIILPGISGTGKSTLAAALLARGGELFSDEVALVLGDGTLAPIPLPPGLKSGSWPLLADDYPCLADASEHLRWDGLRVRYLSPAALRFAADRERPDYLFFPCFRPGKAGGIERLGPVDTLRRLSDTGFQMRALGEKEVEALVSLLAGLQSASLTYASTEEAVRLLSEEFENVESRHVR